MYEWILCIRLDIVDPGRRKNVDIYSCQPCGPTSLSIMTHTIVNSSILEVARVCCIAPNGSVRGDPSTSSEWGLEDIECDDAGDSVVCGDVSLISRTSDLSGGVCD